MTTEKLNSWLAVISNFGVLIGIIFLAVELNQTSIGQRVAAKQEMTRQYSDFVDLLLFNPELRELNNRGMDGDPLAEDELSPFNLLQSKATWYFAAMYYQYISQSLSEEEWAQPRVMIEGYCLRPGYVDWWKNNRQRYSPSFIEFMDQQCQ